MLSLDATVMIVEDLKTMRILMTNILKKLGFTNIIEADSGSAAWEMLNGGKCPVGLILSDVNMPNGNGIDLLKRVRGDSRFNALPFIIVSAEGESHLIVEATRLKVNDYIVKPFTADLVSEKIKKLTAA